MQISLVPTKRDPQRMMIRVAGKVMATLPRTVLAELHIEAGTPWSQALAERVAKAVAFDQARRKAIRLLERRMFGRAELIDRLTRADHPRAAAEVIADEMVERGVIDEAAYGRAIIDAQRARRPAGPHLLRHKLMQRKLSRDLIDKLLAEAIDPADSLEQAMTLAQRRLATVAMAKLDPASRKRRLWGLLQRRGFDAQTCREVLENLPGLRENEVFD
jgi:regulatory protein